MVDALRRAHAMLPPDGRVIDIHPGAPAGRVEVGGVSLGEVTSAEAPNRHAAADRAVETAVAAGLFHLVDARTFEFGTSADSIDELREYVVENWRDSDIGADVLRRARADEKRLGRGARPRIVERVHLNVLRRLGS